MAEDDDPGTGGGEPDDDSTRGWFKPRLDREVKKQTEKIESRLQALEQENASLRASQSAADPEAPQRLTYYTPSQLGAAVENGSITQEQREQYEAAYQRQVVDDQVEERLAGSRFQTQVDEYRALVPNSAVAGTDEYRKLESEVLFLRQEHGLEDNPKTRALAFKNAFGTVAALKAARELDTHRDTTQDGSGPPDGDEGDTSEDGAGLPKWIPAKNRRYYADQISKGIMTKKDAIAEMKAYTGRK